MKPNSHPISSARGFVLPMSLLCVGSMFLLLLGWMSFTGIERKTARSYSDATRAELALESGLSHAISILAEVASRDDTLVFRIDPAEPDSADSQKAFMTYAAIFSDNEWQVVPLFSEASVRSAGDGQIDTRQWTEEISQYIKSSEILTPSGAETPNIPHACWTSMKPEDTAENQIRYAFWIEDLGGRIDAKHAEKIQRGDGKSIQEISLSTLFQENSASGKTPEILLDKRDTLRTTRSLHTILDQPQVERIEPCIAYLPDSTPSKKIIPQGFGYADAGKPAPDLNQLVETGQLDEIAGHIERNLPDFASRAGGFPDSEDYLKTLAANLIDYADADQDSTVGAGYRGIDSYPFVNEWFDRCEWIPGPIGNVNIKVETFVELWNPSQQTIEGEILFINQGGQEIMIPPAAIHQFEPVEFAPIKILMHPNAFLVIPMGEHIQSFPEGAFKPTQLNFLETNKSNFLLKWNGQAVDFARGGVQRTSGLLRAGSGERKWKGIASPAHDIRIGQFGDPRASYYINTPIIANSYDVNSNWGGRSLKRDIAKTKPMLPYAEVRIDQWPDGGSSSSPGVRPVSDSRRPGITHILNSNDTIYPGSGYPASQATFAPARISNSGRYESLCELGNLFDPAQWSDVHSRNALPSAAAGGGFTLAIGRPEFPVFDTEGKRAAQLLDLFSIEPPAGSGRLEGRAININTASREVLRSLVAGVELNADALSEQVAPDHHEAFGDLFADCVIAHRNQSPLRSVSDLNLLRKQPYAERDPQNSDTIPFFGNPANYRNVKTLTNPDDPNDLISWSDAGKEELLRKVIDLVSFQSKSFRVVVAGEVLSAKGKRLARATREFHFTIEPERDVDGMPFSDREPRLIKHYETAY